MVTAAAEMRAAAAGPAASWATDVVEDEPGFDALREDWDRVADEMRPSSPMLSWEWARAWWRYFGVGRLRIVVFRRDGRVVGIAPFFERKVGAGPLAVRTLKPICWEDYGKQGLTEHVELLFPPAERDTLMLRLERWLRESNITLVWLPAIDCASTLPEGLSRTVIEEQPIVPFHHRALPADWLGFVQGLNKSMRSNSRYYAKRLIRLGHSYELRVAESPEDVTHSLVDAIRLHRVRAGAEDVSRVQHWNHFYREDRTAFLSELGPRIARRGEFKLGTLYIDGEVVACQMWFEKRDTMFLYYTGFVPEWAPLGVQLVTTLEVLKHAMGRGIRHFELLRGGGHVKQRWDTDVRLTRNMLFAPNPRIVPGVRLAVRARDAVRSRRP